MKEIPLKINRTKKKSNNRLKSPNHLKEIFDMLQSNRFYIGNPFKINRLIKSKSGNSPSILYEKSLYKISTFNFR